jgi:Peptidase family M1 domain/Peptidase M1 N-terminal domain/Secretion system C-terminal sorting domain
MVNYALLIFIAQLTIQNSQFTIMKNILILLVSLSLGSNCFAQLDESRHAHVDPTFAKTYDPRSDTIDILNYTINLNITDFTNRIIAGNTEVKFRIKQSSIQYLRLDLLKLSVDSVTQNGIRITHNHQNSTINIKLNNILNTGDSAVVKVYYKGTPSGDVTGWGGFYFQAGYAYNLGVGFGADPHVYGRVWFPCFDNFVERSTYDFNITTSNGKIAYCNGALVNDTTNLDGTRTRTWKLTNEIPTYLASVAVGNYVDLKMSHVGKQKQIPILIATTASDSTNNKASLIHLKDAISIFEEKFGPYKWNKVGYTLVPFNSGAMEHATNIAFPRNSLQGLLQGEKTMAHELAHHWFGNLATQSCQEEMWISEGWASFCEILFTEQIYGRTKALQDAKKMHNDLLQTLNYFEGNLCLDSIPWDYTYSDHVYKKGALVVYNLREYLGDSLFYVAVTNTLEKYAFKSMSMSQFEGSLTQESGIDLSDFFNDWIRQPGWSQFSVDSFTTYIDNNKIYAKVFIKQKKYHTRSFHQNVPIEITFRNNNFDTYTKKVLLSNEQSLVEMELPFVPDFVALNYNDKLMLASVARNLTIKSTGTIQLTDARMDITPLNIIDSIFLRIEHNYVSPEGNYNSSVDRISTQRYWKVDGIWNGNNYLKAQIKYDGRIGNGLNTNLDNLLNIRNEDSLILLYRKDRKHDWDEYPHYVKQMENKFDKFGDIYIDSLQLGEYCLGIGKSKFLGLPEKTKKINSKIELYPNPSKEEIYFIQKNEKLIGFKYSIEILDATGKQVMLEKEIDLSNPYRLDIKNLQLGNYLVQIKNQSELIQSIKFQKK